MDCKNFPKHLGIILYVSYWNTKNGKFDGMPRHSLLARKSLLRRNGIRKREICVTSVNVHIYETMKTKSLMYKVTDVVHCLACFVFIFIVHCYEYLLSISWTKLDDIMLLRHLYLPWKYWLRLPSVLLRWYNSSSPNVILYVMTLSSFPVIAEAFCPSVCHCDDASLIVNCENASLEVVPILLNPRVQTILLARNRIDKLLQALVFYTDLKKLDISCNEIITLGKKNFAAQRSLSDLRVSHNKLSFLGGSALQGLEGVRVLHFDNNRISYIEDGAFIGLHSLIELNLSKNKIKSLNENSVIGLSNLQTLNLSGNRFGILPTSGLYNLTSLFKLNLSDNQISQVPSHAFAGLMKLSHLILDKNNISYIEVEAFSSLHELRRLSVTDNRLLHVPSAALGNLPDLQELDLSGNLFEGLPQDCFAGLLSLTSLTVSRCPRLSSVSSEAFISTNNLETLVLSHNPHLVSLTPAAFASLLNLRHVDLSACGLLYLNPTQVPVQQLLSLRVAGNPFHCNCSLLWLSRLAAESNTSSISLDHPTCASPPTLYGVSLRDLGGGGVGCDGQISLLTILICIGVIVIGVAIIVIFLFCRWKKKKREVIKRQELDKNLGVWSDTWRLPDQFSATHLPPPPPPVGGCHFHMTTPSHFQTPPHLPPDHPIHHLDHLHHHHQGCHPQCPFVTLHPVYHPLLHPDHNSSFTTSDTLPPALYTEYPQTHMITRSPTLSARSPPRSLNSSPNWYETLNRNEENEVQESGHGSRPATPLDPNNPSRKVPVTYV
ncbi:hypothetical protein SK128_006047 [Halocaridina rubra]|uniref:LRRCT domain-containing protein n=1 Tax=Halocaridina rubra TaxID=373956 RepID=A0AAN9A2V9_HALRR